MVLALNRETIVLTGPCGPAPWYVQVQRDASPTDVVRALTRLNVCEPAVVHSTSWRHARGGIVLTFVAVVDAVDRLDQIPVKRAVLARGGPASAPELVPIEAVIEHGLRHLAWLATDDPAVAEALPAGWPTALARYAPEPFRQL
jgi:hypothetical protein